jgi:hypothetical protein
LRLDDLRIILTLLAFLGIPVFAIWLVIFRQRPRPEGAEYCCRCNGSGRNVGACQHSAGLGCGLMAILFTGC